MPPWNEIYQSSLGPIRLVLATVGSLTIMAGIFSQGWITILIGCACVASIMADSPAQALWGTVVDIEEEYDGNEHGVWVQPYLIVEVHRAHRLGPQGLGNSLPPGRRRIRCSDVLLPGISPGCQRLLIVRELALVDCYPI